MPMKPLTGQYHSHCPLGIGPFAVVAGYYLSVALPILIASPAYTIERL